MSGRCRSCGAVDGAHGVNCLAAWRAAQEKLQAECDHRSDYGVTRTTGDVPGPRRCGRCGLELPVLSDQAELWDNVDPLRPVGGGFDIAVGKPPAREPLIVQVPTLLSLVNDQLPQHPERDLVFATPVEGQVGSWIVDLICGHRKAVHERKASYVCRECPKVPMKGDT